jgi:hypothetical protein
MRGGREGGRRCREDREEGEAKRRALTEEGDGGRKEMDGGRRWREE